MRALKDGADRDGERLAAFVALIDPGARGLALHLRDAVGVCVATMRAKRAVGPMDCLQGRILQRHDGLGVADRARFDHRQRLVYSDLKDVDVLAFVGVATTGRNAVRRLVKASEEIDLFGHRARAHIGLEQAAHIAHAEAGLLFGLGPDAFLGARIVEQSGRRLYQQVVPAADESGVAELPCEHDSSPDRIVEQDRGTVAAVVGFSALRLPFAVVAAIGEGRLFQDVPVVGQNLDILDADPIGNAHSGNSILPRDARSHGPCLPSATPKWKPDRDGTSVRTERALQGRFGHLPRAPEAFAGRRQTPPRRSGQRTGGAYIRPPAFHKALMPRSIFRSLDWPRLRSKISPKLPTFEMIL